MNIAIDIRSLMQKNRTGVGEYTYELLDALFEIDKNNQYFLFYNSYQDVFEIIPKWEQENVHYVAGRWPNKIFNVLVCLNLIRLDKLVEKIAKRQLDNWTIGQSKFKLDVFFSPNINFISLRSKTKFILTIHDLSFEFFPECFSWKRRLWHWILKPKKQCQRADLILTPSENTRRDVVEYYGIDEGKVEVVEPGLCEEFIVHSSEPIEKVNKKYNLPEKFILYLGTIEPRKNILGIIEAYKKNYELRTIGYELVIAGSKGWNYKQIIKKIDETEGVHYIGYVDEQDKAALYQMADLFVYPSLYEGFGFPVLEAMASGTPVITSNRSSLPEVGGEAVYYVNPYNIVEIARAMKLLLQKDKLRGMLVERGREQTKNFAWQKRFVPNFLAKLKYL